MSDKDKPKETEAACESMPPEDYVEIRISGIPKAVKEMIDQGLVRTPLREEGKAEEAGGGND